eukprot:5242382-Pleurochrysis_carterae.AAC.1
MSVFSSTLGRRSLRRSVGTGGTPNHGPDLQDSSLQAKATHSLNRPTLSEISPFPKHRQLPQPSRGNKRTNVFALPLPLRTAASSERNQAEITPSHYCLATSRSQTPAGDTRSALLTRRSLLADHSTSPDLTRSLPPIVRPEALSARETLTSSFQGQVDRLSNNVGQHSLRPFNTNMDAGACIHEARAKPNGSPRRLEGLNPPVAHAVSQIDADKWSSPKADNQMHPTFQCSTRSIQVQTEPVTVRNPPRITRQDLKLATHAAAAFGSTDDGVAPSLPQSSGLIRKPRYYVLDVRSASLESDYGSQPQDGDDEDLDADDESLNIDGYETISSSGDDGEVEFRSNQRTGKCQTNPAWITSVPTMRRTDNSSSSQFAAAFWATRGGSNSELTHEYERHRIQAAMQRLRNRKAPAYITLGAPERSNVPKGFTPIALGEILGWTSSAQNSDADSSSD